ncbi:Serine protease, subtilisin family [Pseudoxanthomonas sp. GM95]|uniref:S8 family serine peptidase n=1 Tax=Pseudoxanthomonas sp. GM95 TaxID=1881043 RepID=UPI0008ACCBFC|nr:S8 family serine peptidase [Pseudoxanthomonas sp. GM95]SEK60842.1 Serine protease, subtilisin family [Pseudoxanthomonas sp. GM95]
MLAQAAALACALLLGAAPAHAQLRLPATQPLTQALGQTVDPLVHDTTATLDRTLTQARTLGLQKQLRAHRDVLDTDANDNVVVRGEVVAVAPSAEALQHARDAGFSAGPSQPLEGLGLETVSLRAPAGLSTRQAVDKLRALDPGGSYDYDHLYSGGGAGAATQATSSSKTSTSTGGWRVGLVDSGVDASHPALRGARVQRWGCDDAPHPDLHGTAVASLLVGDGQHAQSGTQLLAADVYCGAPTGGNALGLAKALAWMAQQQVQVVNVSLVGPDNALLKQAIAAASARGMVIVAAVGNDGPAAPPLFPAAYPNVIGVTGVDPRDRVLPEAGRGPQVDLAALGIDVQVAAPGGKFQKVRGTSFAAPRVAALAAQAFTDGQDTDALLASLSAQAVDLGKPGVDIIYGRGLVPGRVDERRTTASSAREETQTATRSPL